MRLSTYIHIATYAFLTKELNAFALLKSEATRRISINRLSDSFLDDPVILDMSTLTANGSIHIQNENENSIDRVNNRHSSRDWVHNIASLPKSSVLQEIMNPVLSITAWSSMISIVHRLLTLSSNPMCSNLALNMCIPTQVHSFLVSSLGLLLVFRTNSAYQRFVEGRKIWEQILSTSRNFSRMLNLYEDQIGPERISRIKSTMAAFPYLLRHHIRPKCLDCHANVPKEHQLKIQRVPFEVIETRHEGDKSHGGILDPNDFDVEGKPQQFCMVDKRSLPWSLLSSQSNSSGSGRMNDVLAQCSKAINRPLWSCDRMAREVVSIPYSDTFTSRERLTMIGQINKLSNAIGQCERIHQTSVPLNYARHALRSLTLWLATLPFALVKDLGLLTGPVAGITAWLLFGIYQIGHSIEDPFQKTLRLSILCNAIKRDVMGETEFGSSSSYFIAGAETAVEFQ